MIFRELGDRDRKLVYITHENQREKTYSQYLNEFKIIQSRYPSIKKLNPDSKLLNSTSKLLTSNSVQKTLYVDTDIKLDNE